ncbi:MAG: alpha-glucosidase [Alphaproteobacteria bacterium]|nr:alpha-glucosidase [Alphaproteobacteria bacterium]
MDSNGDGVGDLPGITQKIPYISDLGVDAVWISPFVKSPQKDFGYDVSDYYDVDPRFGTLRDFEKLLNKAHKHSLKIIIDQVWCHCSDQHPWFVQGSSSTNNAKADWFVWANGKKDGTPPNNWLSYFGGSAWTWNTARQQYYFHQFLTSQPTFNLRNTAVRRALMSVGKFWLEMGVDGFRLDAIHTGFADPLLRNNPARPAFMPVAPDVPDNIPQARQIRKYSEAHADTLPFIEELRHQADKYGAILLGEVNGENPYARAAQYTAKGRLHTAYSFSLLKNKPDAAMFKQAVVDVEKNKKRGQSFCYTLSNHDVMRVRSRWGRGSERVALLFGLCLPGHYCMYQGEELGLTEADVPYDKMVDPFGLAFYPKFKGRDGCRTPMPWDDKKAHGGFSAAQSTWLPFAKEHGRLSVTAQQKKPNSTLAFAKRIIAWRKSEPVMLTDGFRAVPASKGLIIFERFNAGYKKRVVRCVFNLTDKVIAYSIQSEAVCDVLFSVNLKRQGRLVLLQPMSALILLTH